MPIDELPLLDHHAHGIYERDLEAAEVERWLSETYLPPAPGCSWWDSPLGLAVRAHCAPILDLEPFASPELYVQQRRRLGGEEVSRRLLAAAGVSSLLIDTGMADLDLCSPERLGELANASAHEVVRLEPLAEGLAASHISPSEYPERLEAAVRDGVRRAVGAKSVIAYRSGLAISPSRPATADVIKAAELWMSQATDGQPLRLTETTLHHHLVWVGVDACHEFGRPLQFHVGLGDPDLDLRAVDPTLLTPLIRAIQPLGVPLTLLHNYPFQRQAAYLASMFPNVYVDVGLGLNHVGPSAHTVLAELMEYTPFHKQLYSSDAIALAELHYLGAFLFRRALDTVFENWMKTGDLSAADAERIALQLAGGNANRIYPLADGGR
jgi:predicted TIM-barrel fold metal-dependent hydrolase